MSIDNDQIDISEGSCALSEVMDQKLKLIKKMINE